MVRYKTPIVHLIAYSLAIGSTLRYIDYFRLSPSWPTIALLLVAFFLLLVVEGWLVYLSRRAIHLYLAVQTCLLVAVSLVSGIEDFLAIPFMSLILQAMLVLPPRVGFRWIAIFTTIVTVFVPLFGRRFHGIAWKTSAANVLIYATAYFFFGAFVAMVDQVDASRKEAEVAGSKSEELLKELRITHEQLHLHTEQAEELAVIQERNRLARNLHDSVTQTIFSMTLTAEAANLLFERDPAQASFHLNQLQDLAKSALAEMRSLVFELRPTAVAERGLIAALRYHIVTLERRHGLTVILDVTGEPQLSDEEAQRLFRVIQEALNNVVKHADTDGATVTMRFENGRSRVQVEDHGRGFVPEVVGSAGTESMGLASMRERVETLGGILTIESRPGKGTCVAVEIISKNGEENHGQD